MRLVSRLDRLETKYPLIIESASLDITFIQQGEEPGEADIVIEFVHHEKIVDEIEAVEPPKPADLSDWRDAEWSRAGRLLYF